MKLTLRARLTLVVTILGTLVVVAAGVLLVDQVTLALERSVQASVEELLRSSFRDLGGEVGEDGDGYRAFVIDADGRRVAPGGLLDQLIAVSPPIDDAPDAQPMSGAGTAVPEPQPYDDGPGRVAVSIPLDLPGGPSYRLVTSQSLQVVDDQIDRFVGILLLVVPLLVVVIAVLTWFTSSQILRPVARITERAKSIDADRLAARVEVPDSGDEIAELAETINRMLARLEEASALQRQFVADASHELRTPLAIIGADLQTALAHPERTNLPDRLHDLLEEQQRMSAIVDDLLHLSAQDAGRPRRAVDVDLDDVVADEVAIRRDPGLRSRVAPARMVGDPDHLRRCVRNLLDNAQRHRRTTTVVEVVADPEGAITLTVEDDGEGIDEEDRERVFDRFVRLDEARGRTAGGAGLGLAIARQIVGAHDGVLSVTRGRSGGARFEATFPSQERLASAHGPTSHGRHRSVR